jgi:hypothetical protein
VAVFVFTPLMYSSTFRIKWSVSLFTDPLLVTSIQDTTWSMCGDLDVCLCSGSSTFPNWSGLCIKAYMFTFTFTT